MPGKHGEEGHSKQRGKDQEQLGIYGETQWRLSVAGEENSSQIMLDKMLERQCEMLSLGCHCK